MNRRSELQRKLESTPAPKPPANLAERIKSEIPKDLRFNVDEERERLSGGIALNLRVAASILVLVSTVYLALHVLTRTTEKPATVPDVAALPAAKVVPLPTSTQSASTAETVAIVNAPAAPEALLKRSTAKPKSVVAEVEKKQLKEEEADRDKGTRTNAVDAVAIAAPAEVAPAAAPPPAAAAEKITIVQSAPQAQAARSAMAAKSAMHDERREVKADDSIVQRFARPDVMPSAAVLDVEAVEEPVMPHHIVVRISFDAGTPVKDLWVDTMVSTPTSASARWLASSWRWGAASFANASRSAIVEFALTSSDAPLVTIRARYRTADDSIEQSVEKVIRRSDVRAWSVASKRMKSATLAALWQNGADANEIAQAARDAGLDDLVRSIEAAR